MTESDIKELVGSIDRKWKVTPRQAIKKLVAKIAYAEGKANFGIAWCTLYDGFARSTGIDVRSLAQEQDKSILDVVEDMGMMDDLMEIAESILKRKGNRC